MQASINIVPRGVPMKLITIKVTAKDIKNGTHSGFSCPVSRAMQRSRSIRSDDYCSDNAPWLPARAKQWIRRFDDNKPVKPFSFKVKA